MAIDKAVDSAALEAALKASADAIREKTGDAASIPWDAAKGFADAIAAIEAGGGSGGAIVGEVTPSEGQITIDLSGYGVANDANNTPRAMFLLEKVLNTNDNTHTKNRVFFTAKVSSDNCTYAPENTRYTVSVCLYSTSGSSSLKVVNTSVANMWDSSATGANNFSTIAGKITSGGAEMYISDPAKSYGPISGRTYIWGVIL